MFRKVGQEKVSCEGDVISVPSSETIAVVFGKNLRLNYIFIKEEKQTV